MAKLAQVQSIVLRRMNYRESSMIVDVFSKKHGVVGCIVSGVRKKGSKLSPVLFTPGYLLDLVYYAGDPHKLWRIKEVNLTCHLQKIPFDILRGNIALCMCEILKKVLPVHDENPDFYEFVESYIYLLDKIEKPANLFIHFLAQLSVQLGFGPEYNPNQVLPYFDIRSGSFEEAIPSHPLYLDENVSLILFDILLVDKENLSKIKMSRSMRQQLTDHLIDYIRFHTHAFDRIKSFDVLKSLW